MLNKENILKSLAAVKIPDLKNDLVTSGMISVLKLLEKLSDSIWTFQHQRITMR
jgi:hypothetical protein